MFIYFVHLSDSEWPFAGLLPGIFYICEPVEQPAVTCPEVVSRFN